MPADKRPTRIKRYHSYLLRLWKEHTHAPWRASLQDAVDGTRHGFASLESMVAFLHAKTNDDEDDAPKPSRLLENAKVANTRLYNSKKRNDS
jgi:hypothetical protein